MTQPNERPAIEAAKAHYAQVEQQGFAQQQQQQVQPPAQIPIRDLIAMLRQLNRGEPALGRAAAYQYALECGYPPAEGYAGSGEFGTYHVSSYNEVYTFCQQAGVNLPPLQAPPAPPQAPPQAAAPAAPQWAPAPPQAPPQAAAPQWAPAPHPDPYPHLPAILPPDAPAPGQYAAYAQQHPEPVVAPATPAPAQYPASEQTMVSQPPAAPMPAALQAATPGKRGRPAKKQDAAPAPAAPVTTAPVYTPLPMAMTVPMNTTMPISTNPQPSVAAPVYTTQVALPVATSNQMPTPAVPKPNGLHLYVDCIPEHVATQSLNAYLNDAATTIAKRYNVVDIRLAESDPLKYGWRGVFAAVLQGNPPPNGHYVLDTRGNEFAMQAASALLPLCASYIRGR